MKRSKKKIYLLILIGLTLLWFLGVDMVFYNDTCLYCGRHRDVIQYRVLGIPIHESSLGYYAITNSIASDLGAPCLHNDTMRLPLNHWLGLCVRMLPCLNIDWTLGDDDSWYNDEIKAKVKEKAANNPRMGPEFRENVLRDNNLNYWYRFKQELLDEEIEKIVFIEEELPEAKVREIVDRIKDIEWLIIEHDKLQPDENATQILALGEKGAPYIAEKITDTNPSKWLAWGTVGDVAHLLLCTIYRKDWPSENFKKEYGITWERSYREFHLKYLATLDHKENNKNRLNLQEAWMKFIQKGGEGDE